jgi:hypothetical protein
MKTGSMAHKNKPGMGASDQRIIRETRNPEVTSASRRKASETRIRIVHDGPINSSPLRSVIDSWLARTMAADIARGVNLLKSTRRPTGTDKKPLISQSRKS